MFMKKVSAVNTQLWADINGSFKSQDTVMVIFSNLFCEAHTSK